MSDPEVFRKLDDHERRLTSIEATRGHVDDKIDALRQLIDVKLEGINKSIEGWNKLGFWLLTTVGGVLVTGVVGAGIWFIANGGMK